MMKLAKIIFISLINLMIILIPLKVLAVDIGLEVKVDLVNPEGPSYYTWIRLKDIDGRGKIEVLRDGAATNLGDTAGPYTDHDTGQKMLLHTPDSNPPEGEHTYKVTVYDSAGKVLGSSSAEVIVPSGSYIPSPQPPSGSGTVTEFGNTDFGGYVSKILTWLVTIVSSLAVLMFIYAGYIYVTSQGSPEGVTQAKDIIIGVITGIILLFLIEVILVKTVGIKWQYL